MEGAKNIEESTTTKTRNPTYNNLVVREDLAPEPTLQHNPQALGPKQQQSSSKHIVTNISQIVLSRFV